MEPLLCSRGMPQCGVTLCVSLCVWLGWCVCVWVCVVFNGSVSLCACGLVDICPVSPWLTLLV